MNKSAAPAAASANSLFESNTCGTPSIAWSSTGTLASRSCLKSRSLLSSGIVVSAVPWKITVGGKAAVM
jgi:hypothetical protein